MADAGDGTPRLRSFFFADVTAWGPSARAWLVQTGGQLYDSFAFQETHVLGEGLNEAEQYLRKRGFTACFTAARQSLGSEHGSYGGTAVAMRGAFPDVDISSQGEARCSL